MMRKKTIIYFFTILIMFLIVGCKNNEEVISNNQQVIDNNNNDTEEINNNTLVLYFSASGTTKSIAERIAKESNSDIIEIIPTEEYTAEDLNYNADCRANDEQKDNDARPEIKNEININEYDIIYLGYPIWWGTNPKIILTLLDTYDFTNKTIIPFCTSGSTGINTSVNDLRNYNNKLTIKDGKRFSISDDDELIKDFIKEN